MVRMSSESGLNVDGAVLSWSIILSGQSLVEIKSLRNDANTTPKRVPNVYHIPSRISRKYRYLRFLKIYIFSIFGYIF